jgi:hypothetical protein
MRVKGINSLAGSTVLLRLVTGASRLANYSAARGVMTLIRRF